jgi:hypothetical protein
MTRISLYTPRILTLKQQFRIFKSKQAAGPVVHHFMSKSMIIVVIFGLLSLHVPVCHAVARDTISAGQRLSGNDTLVSNNGRFVVGFYQTFGKSSDSASSKWYLGVWFNTVPNFTPALVANRDKPALVEKGSLVQHPNVICPGSVGHWGPMTRLGPGSCRLEISPGSFRGTGPGLWHEPGPMPPSMTRVSLRIIGPGSWHKPGSKTLPWL